MQLKVLTYNIHKGRRGHSKTLILDELKAAIKTTQADIVCLQEVQGAHHQISEPQLESLADEVWSHYAYARNAMTAKNGHHGNAILSRFPIKSHTNTNLAFMKGASRSILQAEIELPELGQSIQLMCVHLGLLGIERRVQIHKLQQRINQLDPATPLILAGDFNDWARVGHRTLKRRGDLHELAENLNGRLARTFPARMPVLTVDRIYTRNLRQVAVEKHLPKHWQTLSDHLPLIGTLEVMARPA